MRNYRRNKNVRRIIVAGTRDFDDYELMEKYLDKVLPLYDEEIEIVSGHAEGADKLGERYAKEHNIKCAVFPADWKSYGRKAGPIRNTQMIEYASLEIPEVIAFWDGQSHGTLDTMVKAQNRRMKCTAIIYATCEPIIVEYKYQSMKEFETAELL